MRFTMTKDARRACEIISGMDYQTLQSVSLGGSRGKPSTGQPGRQTTDIVAPRGSVYLQQGRISSLQKAKNAISRFK